MKPSKPIHYIARGFDAAGRLQAEGIYRSRASAEAFVDLRTGAAFGADHWDIEVVLHLGYDKCPCTERPSEVQP